ncbi:MAG: SCO family protein [Anaerolineales bacterium]|nr:SCO family protein [Anaerolineales bacterium]
MLFAVFQPVKVLPRVRLSPGFALVDQNAETLTNESLRGNIVLYNFTYTRCPEPCMDMNETMQTIQKNVAEMELNGVPFTLVTISFDPEYDTPAVLKAYANSMGATPTNWYFATLNDPSLLKTIVGGGFEAYYEKQADGSFRFTPTYVLVDGWGIVRGQYRYETLASTADRITRHVGVLVEEVQKSVGATKLVYEAAHLFLCYAP